MLIATTTVVTKFDIHLMELIDPTLKLTHLLILFVFLLTVTFLQIFQIGRTEYLFVKLFILLVICITRITGMFENGDLLSIDPVDQGILMRRFISRYQVTSLLYCSFIDFTITHDRIFKIIKYFIDRSIIYIFKQHDF